MPAEPAGDGATVQGSEVGSEVIRIARRIMEAQVIVRIEDMNWDAVLLCVLSLLLTPTLLPT